MSIYIITGNFWRFSYFIQSLETLYVKRMLHSTNLWVLLCSSSGNWRSQCTTSQRGRSQGGIHFCSISFPLGIVKLPRIRTYSWRSEVRYFFLGTRLMISSFIFLWLETICNLLSLFFGWVYINGEDLPLKLQTDLIFNDLVKLRWKLWHLVLVAQLELHNIIVEY